MFRLINFIWKNLGTILLFTIVFYLVNQLSFTWKHDEYQTTSAKEHIDDDEVVFLLMKEEHVGREKTAFKSLLERLKTWEYDEDQKEVYLKFASQQASEDGTVIKPIPNALTKVMVLYNRDFDSFQKYSDFFSITSFPYEYHFQDKPLISIQSIEKDGAIFLEYKGKRIRLAPGETYPEWTVKNFNVYHTTISNEGIYNKEQFKMMNNKK